MAFVCGRPVCRHNAAFSPSRVQAQAGRHRHQIVNTEGYLNSLTGNEEMSQNSGVYNEEDM